MARNGSGTYTVPNTFSPGDTISSSDHNENFDDLGDEITNSVAADGQTTMTGPLKAASGTAAVPSITFGADTDLGLYRAGGNELGVAAGGAAVALFTTATAHLYGALVVSATASFGAIAGSLTFGATATFSATATFQSGFIASATATFTDAIIVSATATFNSALIASATATFTTRVNIAGSQAVTLATQGLTFIETQTPSAVGQIDFTTGLDNTYDTFVLVVSGFKPATDDVNFQVRLGTGAGPTYATSNYQYKFVDVGAGSFSSSGTAVAVLVTPAGGGTGVGNASGENVCATIRFTNPEASDHCLISFDAEFVNAGGNSNRISGVGSLGSASAITGIRLMFSSGNIASGRATLYGLRKS